MRFKKLMFCGLLAGALSLYGCDSDSDSAAIDPGGNAGDGDTLQVPETFAFESRFTPGESSVSYDGQVARQVLIADLRKIVDGMGERITSGEFSAGTTTRDEVLAVMESYFDEGVDTLAAESILLLPDSVATLQPTYGEISSDKNLRGKTAGNDDVTDHKDWDGDDTAGATPAFVGWPNQTPESLVRMWFDEVADNVMTELNGIQRTLDVGGTPVDVPVYISDNGYHLGQLVEKFLLAAVAYSQGTDDYLDDDVDGKGLLTDNVNPDGDDSPFTTLEHQWDEGFGYFGAARDYNGYTDQEIADDVFRDSVEVDGSIDLQSEFNFALAGYAAKRDLGSTDPQTDFSKAIFDGLLTGRAIITAADGDLTSEELADLQDQRDIVVENWETVMAANVAHYINTTLSDMADLEQTVNLENLEALAAHWSEMKAFALMLQFNPRKAISDADLDTLHGRIGIAPVLPGEAGFDTYDEDLVQARALIRDAYGFSDANVENW